MAILVLDRYLASLNEVKKASRIKITKKTKIKRATSQMSTVMARNRNDPMYEQMKLYCGKCKELKDKIHKKYAAKNRARAKE